MSRNVQPFYHRVDGLLFTATRPVSEEELLDILRKHLVEIDVLPESVYIEDYGDAEAGDPSDLL